MRKKSYQPQKEAYKLLSVRTISLEKRYSNSFMNEVFKENILLNLAYLKGKQKTSQPEWDGVNKPMSLSFTGESLHVAIAEKG